MNSFAPLATNLSKCPDLCGAWPGIVEQCKAIVKDLPSHEPVGEMLVLTRTAKEATSQHARSGSPNVEASTAEDCRGDSDPVQVKTSRPPPKATLSTKRAVAEDQDALTIKSQHSADSDLSPVMRANRGGGFSTERQIKGLRG